jgi:hypothetical protein
MFLRYFSCKTELKFGFVISKSLDPDFSIIKDDQKNCIAGDLSLIIRNLEQMLSASKIKKKKKIQGLSLGFFFFYIRKQTCGYGLSCRSTWLFFVFSLY